MRALLMPGVGDALAGYEIEELLKAALKVLLPEFAGDDDFRERFIRAKVRQ